MPMFHPAAARTPGAFFDAVAGAAGARGERPAARTTSQVVERLFERYDADANASITLTEVLTVVDPDGTRTEAAAAATAAVEAIDSNADDALSSAEVSTAVDSADSDADGLLSRDEMADAESLAVLARGGDRGHRGPGGPGGPGDGGGAHEAPTIEDLSARIVERFDADENGTISAEEIIALIDPDGDDDDAASRADAAIAAIDANADEGLDSGEISGALTATDDDADGTIERGEIDREDDGALATLLHGGRGPGGRPDADPPSLDELIERAFARFDDDGDGAISSAELVAALDPRGRFDDLATMIAEQLATLDGDASGGLSASELGTALAAFDTDGDGLLDQRPGHGGDEPMQLIGILLHAHPFGG